MATQSNVSLSETASCGIQSIRAGFFPVWVSMWLSKIARLCKILKWHSEHSCGFFSRPMWVRHVTLKTASIVHKFLVAFRAFMLTHTGKKPHSMLWLHKKFARLTNLKSHMLTHTRKKPHECSECHKKFLLLSTLRSHMLTHTGKKQHECSECHKKFSQSYNLQRHMLTHTGEKPHKCSECHKKFSQSCNLQSHMLTHTEEKAHKCSVCHRRFSQKGSLKIHMSKQHSQWEENLIIITPRIDNVIINCTMLTHILTKSIPVRMLGMRQLMLRYWDNTTSSRCHGYKDDFVLYVVLWVCKTQWPSIEIKWDCDYYVCLYRIIFMMSYWCCDIYFFQGWFALCAVCVHKFAVYSKTAYLDLSVLPESLESISLSVSYTKQVP